MTQMSEFISNEVLHEDLHEYWVQNPDITLLLYVDDQLIAATD